jgi:hypothetical protein
MTYRPYASIVSAIQSSNLKSNLLNNSGLTIQKYQPVRINSNGDMSVIDVSLDAHALGTVGVVEDITVNGAYGYVVTHGKVENISTFNLGDFIYVSKTGGLTNSLPSEGVDGFIAGDWVIRVGVIGKNEDDPILKDLFINFQIIGQL